VVAREIAEDPKEKKNCICIEAHRHQATLGKKEKKKRKARAPQVQHVTTK